MSRYIDKNDRLQRNQDDLEFSILVFCIIFMYLVNNYVSIAKSLFVYSFNKLTSLKIVSRSILFILANTIRKILTELVFEVIRLHNQT